MPDLLSRLRASLAGRYAVERALGQGGMATVYLARDERHHRQVAIKVLSPDLAATLGQERFLQEIEIAAGLTHPNVLPLHDSGQVSADADGPALLYYVMPFVEGETLRDRLKRERQLPAADAMRIASEVGAALDYAHRKGVVHRDVKPENILLADGHAVVADFGIARAITAAGGERLTATGLAIGTAAYMSPEQATADHALDGRSDLYSLGVVVFEMLAGEPPFTGPTAQAILAKRFAGPAPDLSVVRPGLSVSVTRAVARTLEPVPADRFSTAAEFVTALSSQSTAASGVVAAVRSGRWSTGVAFLLLAVFAIGAYLIWRPTRALALDPNLVAVAPFDVRGAGLETWREGLMDYLSRSLDGAGPVRTVSPSIFVRSWTGPADPASTRALGRRVGAGLVVSGSAIRGGGDSVRLRASLLDVATGSTSGETELVGDTLSIDRLADSLALKLLAVIGQTRPVGAVRNTPFGGVALPALKSYLRGEQMYRRSLWDSALVYYGRAVAEDSTFAPASRRMSMVLDWNPATSGDYQASEDYLRREVTFNHGWGPRDSLLIAIDAVSKPDAPPDSVFLWWSRLGPLLSEATRRFPGDPEVWMAVGEARFHGGPLTGTSEQALMAFDRAIELDSGLAPAYEHTLGLAIRIGGPERAARYVAALHRMNLANANAASPLEHITTMLAAAALLDTAGLLTVDRARLIESASVLELYSAGIEHLAAWPDSTETAVQLFRSLAAGNHRAAGAPEWVVDPGMWPTYLAMTLIARGHLREAWAVYQPRLGRTDSLWYADFLTPVLQLALLTSEAARLPSDYLGGELPAAAERRLQTPDGWLVTGDSGALARYHDQMRRQAQDTPAGPERVRVESQALLAGAYLALVRSDSAEALRRMGAIPDSACLLMYCRLLKYHEARLLTARGQDREAGEILDRWLEVQGGATFTIPAVLERAQVAERLGEGEKARRLYQLFIDFWRDADPELQGYVSQARAGLLRVEGMASNR